jgi:hypothetical protein
MMLEKLSYFWVLWGCFCCLSTVCERIFFFGVFAINFCFELFVYR